MTSDAPPLLMNGSGMPVTGMQPDDHPHVDEQLEQEHRREPGPEQEAERVTRRPAQARMRHSRAAIQHEHDERPDEAELLGEHREHEVALLDREELAAASACRW